MAFSLDKRCEKIKVVLTDVDGVLTDGGMYYSRKGDSMKKNFCPRWNGCDTIT